MNTEKTPEHLDKIREATYQEWWRLAREMFGKRLDEMDEDVMRFMMLAYQDGWRNGVHYATTNDTFGVAP